MEKNLNVWLNIQFPVEANKLGTVEVNFNTSEYFRTGDKFYGK